MGRGQKNNKKPKHQEPESQQQEVQEEQYDQDEADYAQDEEQDLLPGEYDQDIDGDQIILKKIQDKILQCDQEEKLSWGAIYQLKKQQTDLNEEMQKEIDQIKEKYELKRVPIMNKIADAVAGKKLDKSIYSENEFTKSINLNKTKPKAIRDYWGKVFDACGLVGNQDDIDLLENLTSFRCEILDGNIQNIKIIFEFQENEYFGPKVQVEVKGSVSQGSFSRKIEYETKEKGKQIDQNSLFGLLTKSDSDDQQFLDTCHDLYRAYVSSTYFYFYEQPDDLQNGEDGEDEDEEQQGEGESDQEDQKESQEGIKAVKKGKGSGIVQKPECKPQ